MSDAAQRFTHGAAIGVDIAGIERELAALWREAAQGATAVMRACSWNLVVLTTPAQLARARALADVMVELVPSRTLLIDEQPGDEALRAFVSANCRLMPGGGKMLCTEEITLEARGAAAGALPSLVRALQVPDISTAVLCAGVPAESAMLGELAAAARRVIVDSRGLDVEGFEAFGRGCIDLAWLRVAPWQRAMIDAFDEQHFEKRAPVIVRVPKEDASEAKWFSTWIRNRLEVDVTIEPGREAMVLIGARVFQLPALLHDERALIHAALTTGAISSAYKTARDAFRLTGAHGASCSWADFTQRFVDAADAAITARGVFTCALTGGSAVKMYPQLARANLDWKRIELFLGDERLVPLESADSNYRAAREALPNARIHPVRVELDPHAAAADYERLLPAQLDLVHLGLGPDGHVASLFPGHALLHERQARVAAVLDSPKPPSERVTFTLPTITNAREVWFLVSGEAKRPVADAARTDPASRLPAALVHRGARRATWFLDL